MWSVQLLITSLVLAAIYTHIVSDMCSAHVHHLHVKMLQYACSSYVKCMSAFNSLGQHIIHILLYHSSQGDEAIYLNGTHFVSRRQKTACLLHHCIILVDTCSFCTHVCFVSGDHALLGTRLGTKTVWEFYICAIS